MLQKTYKINKKKKATKSIFLKVKGLCVGWLLCFSDLNIEPNIYLWVFINCNTFGTQCWGYKFIKKSFAF